jgi:hypothetical protein
MAQAPSDDGQVSPSLTGSQSIIVSLMLSNVASSWWRCAYGFFSALSRSFSATSTPM